MELAAEQPMQVRTNRVESSRLIIVIATLSLGMKVRAYEAERTDANCRKGQSRERVYLFHPQIRRITVCRC